MNFHIFIFSICLVEQKCKFFTIPQISTLELEGEVTQFVLKEMCFSKVIPLVLSVNTFNFAIILRKCGHGLLPAKLSSLKIFPPQKN